MATLVANSLRRHRGTALGGDSPLGMRGGAITHYREQWKMARDQRKRNAMSAGGC
jgi:hypothetical protein